jgi:hypothetical protein
VNTLLFRQPCAHDWNHSGCSHRRYDLTSLFVGSEGTLGVVVEATLKLVPVRQLWWHIAAGCCTHYQWVSVYLFPSAQIPEQSAVAVCSFETLHDASSAVRAIIQRGIQVNCVELLDDVMIECGGFCFRCLNDTAGVWMCCEFTLSRSTVNKYANYTFPVKPHIFFKFSGTSDQVAHDAA